MMNVSDPTGPFRSSIVTDDTTGRAVFRVYTCGGNAWLVKALDGRRWPAGRGMTTDVRGFRSRRAAIRFATTNGLTEAQRAILADLTKLPKSRRTPSGRIKYNNFDHYDGRSLRGLYEKGFLIPEESGVLLTNGTVGRPQKGETE